ncbi:hypothetical protein EGW08_009485 [Elysia chlorotica]|uniref:Uncharacterized protein n=1 Tax=Elysia chlorotica TaxID=188477 RepID=A0A3S1BFF7_ELYCH|nr:hypothetical protein EGW08_009485 [Elysia chlorotica]
MGKHAIVAVLCILKGSCANHHHPWIHPCMPGHRVSSESISSDMNSLMQQRWMLHESINIAKHTARYLRLFISRNHLQNSYLRQECLNNTLLGMPDYPSTPVVETWQDNLSNDFHRLTLLIMYVYEAKLDAMDYSDRLHNFLTQLRDAACFMENTAILSNRELYYTVRPTSVPECYRYLPDQARRDRRNCLIARHAFDVLNVMSTTYRLIQPPTLIQ